MNSYPDNTEPVSEVLMVPVDCRHISPREGATIRGSDGDDGGVASGVRITISGGSGLRGPAPIPCQRQEQSRSGILQRSDLLG